MDGKLTAKVNECLTGFVVGQLAVCPCCKGGIIMCLYITNRGIQIAKEDIICYKILVKERKKWIPRIFHKSTYRAPFNRHYTYQLKGLNDLRESLYISCPVYPEVSPCGVVREGFHSFADIRDAERMLFEWDYIPGVGKIVQCIIPKGAEYIKGTIGLSQNSPANYVSNKIICVKEV